MAVPFMLKIECQCSAGKSFHSYGSSLPVGRGALPGMGQYVDMTH